MQESDVCEGRDELAASREVVAAQFAGGLTIARLAEDWEKSVAWIEDAIRHALLLYIPRRSGGLKASRTEVKAERSEELAAIRAAQEKLFAPPQKRVVGYGENGYRVGEGHHCSRISDELVDHIRELHEDQGKGVREIARELNLPPATVSDICNYKRRAERPVKWKKVTK
ncbi:MAG TPA: helix-turn-helix domain-containing protein [Alloacidobacterium sp.]|nr:helix-turn-helix domain-containing protein [Alloacidobacterium sp.]